jgi:hypothetical protein
MPATPERIALIKEYLPSAAMDLEADGGYGWTDEYITNLLNTYGFSPAQAVRFFWHQRVSETAEYLDIGKPLTQIHQQAERRLAYWDSIILGNVRAGTPDGMEPVDENQRPRVPISFGEIQRPWE